MSTVRRPRVQRDSEVQQIDKPQEQQDILSFLPEENQPLLATNTGVRLACTMAAMLSPFAIFLCWAERESRVIRRFAVQSTTLEILHLLGGAILVIVSLLVGSIPYLGFLMRLLGWLIYIAIALVALLLRVKLMEHAWHGRRFDLPLMEKLIHKYY
ncbi:MAG: hypothetical protein E7318_11620 [Clostridiales bacterium]|nr:hypothetical protein [Clostridiales bacterium]